MGVLMPLDKGVKKVVKTLVSADSTDLALVVMTSEEDIVDRDRQCIVDALPSETFIDHLFCSGVEELIVPQKSGTVVKPLFSCSTTPTHIEQEIYSHSLNAFVVDYNRLQCS